MSKKKKSKSKDYYKQLAIRQRRLKRLKNRYSRIPEDQKDLFRERFLHISERDTRRFRNAGKIVRKNVAWAMGAGFVPVPLLDAGLASFVQLKMLSDLAYNYELPFSRDMVKSIVATLLGYLSVNTLRNSLITSMVKSLPYANIVGIMTMPVYAGAVTYAIGKIFVSHFESGGSFKNFNPKKNKNLFNELYQEGLTVASDMKNLRRTNAKKQCEEEGR
jgi:uncharacterized protein (DUF697 family)